MSIHHTFQTIRETVDHKTRRGRSTDRVHKEVQTGTRRCEIHIARTGQKSPHRDLRAPQTQYRHTRGMGYRSDHQFSFRM